MTRAIKGGQIGANGEFYKGGQFLNTISENNKREGSTPRKPRKVQVEPYAWVVSDRTPIFSLVGTLATYENRYDRSNNRIIPFESNIGGAATEWKGKTVAEWCDLYNAGERWMD